MGVDFDGLFDTDFVVELGVKDRFSIRLSTSSSLAARKVKETIVPCESITRVD